VIEITPDRMTLVLCGRVYRLPGREKVSVISWTGKYEPTGTIKKSKSNF